MTTFAGADDVFVAVAVFVGLPVAVLVLVVVAVFVGVPVSVAVFVEVAVGGGTPHKLNGDDRFCGLLGVSN